MERDLKKILRKLIPVFLIVSNTVIASSTELDKAVKIYYAGYPHQAISLIEPLALSGDVEAQYLLGNILYSLSKTRKFSATDDPEKWYEMAAVQDSPGANYALGVIYHNNSTESHRKEDITTAISYYEKALELGYVDAQAPLSELKSQLGTSNESQSLSNSNLSNGTSKQASQIPDEKVGKESGTDGLADIGKEASDEINSIESGTENLADIAKEFPDENSSIESPTDNLADIGKETPDEIISIESGIVNLAAIAKEISDENSSIESRTVDLTDIANQCSNYTRTGFDYYAESIMGAFIVGNAKIDTIGVTPSESDTQLIRLIKKQFDIVILLALHGVPNEVATGLKQGQDFGITGIVGNSQKIGSDCELILTYQSPQ